MTIWQRVKRDWLALTLLTLAALFCCTMIVVRYAYFGRLAYTFLIWNLFLAFVPLGVAWVVRVFKPPLLIMFALAGVWLLFLPNAPYILTDVVHLRTYGNRDIWMDLSIILLFAITGLFAGYTSLAWMQAEIKARFGAVSGWVFALGAMVASGFGVYIGRFLRWNSWDAFTNPEILLADISREFGSFYQIAHASALSLIFAAIFLFGYGMLFALPQLAVVNEQ